MKKYSKYIVILCGLLCIGSGIFILSDKKPKEDEKLIKDRENLIGESMKEMDIRNYIEESITKLDSLGINALDMKDEITSHLIDWPEDIRDSLSAEQVLGLILDDIGYSEYDIERNECISFPNNVYSFDVEVAYVDIMYTIFLNTIVALSNNEINITDIVEDTSNVNYEEGTGIQIVTFKLNEKEYKYEARVYYDWFDGGIISYVNQILQEQNSDKFLYVTGDGWQNCIVFYNTEEWAKKYNQAFPELPIERM